MTLKHQSTVAREFPAVLKLQLAAIAGAVEIRTIIAKRAQGLRRGLAKKIFA